MQETTPMNARFHIALAAFADDAPADIREAATRRYGAPAGTAPPHRSSPPNKKKSGA